MYTQDGTLISASAAPNCGVTLTGDGKRGKSDTVTGFGKGIRRHKISQRCRSKCKRGGGETKRLTERGEEELTGKLID